MTNEGRPLNPDGPVEPLRLCRAGERIIDTAQSAFVAGLEPGERYVGPVRTMEVTWEEFAGVFDDSPAPAHERRDEAVMRFLKPLVQAEERAMEWPNTHECEWCKTRVSRPDQSGRQFHCPFCAQSPARDGWLMLPL